MGLDKLIPLIQWFQRWWRRRESNPRKLLKTLKLLISGKAKRATKARKANRLYKRCTKMSFHDRPATRSTPQEYLPQMVRPQANFGLARTGAKFRQLTG